MPSPDFSGEPMKGAKKDTRSKRSRTQYAALPYRRDETIEVLLLSSRETGRWVLPKGWPMKGRKPRAAAEREALEEAGIVGKIGKAPIGVYHYVKRMKNGTAQRCAVTVFPLKVKRQRKNWPEKGERNYRWFPLAKAAKAVEEPELRDMIRTFKALLDEE